MLGPRCERDLIFVLNVQIQVRQANEVLKERHFPFQTRKDVENKLKSLKSFTIFTGDGVRGSPRHVLPSSSSSP